jgi:hypothetical protein
MKTLLNIAASSTLALTVLGLAAPPASAREHICTARAGQAELDRAALTRSLAAAGLTRIGEWERESGCIETRARAVDGRAVELTLDPYAGTILHQERENTEGRERDGEAQSRERPDRRS